jgi:hypothetical protein
MNRCPKCKREIEENSTFCEYCGYQLKRSKKTVPVWVAVVAAVAIIGIVVLAISLSGGSKSNESQQSSGFPYNTYFTGTIGSNGSLVIDSQGGGNYTVEYGGKPVTRSIKVKNYDRETGRLLIEGYDTSGAYIGLFDGIVVNEYSYSGTFSNYRGGTVEFQLSLVTNY